MVNNVRANNEKLKEENKEKQKEKEKEKEEYVEEKNGDSRAYYLITANQAFAGRHDCPMALSASSSTTASHGSSSSSSSSIASGINSIPFASIPTAASPAVTTNIPRFPYHTPTLNHLAILLFLCLAPMFPHPSCLLTQTLLPPLPLVQRLPHLPLLLFLLNPLCALLPHNHRG